MFDDRRLGVTTMLRVVNWLKWLATGALLPVAGCGIWGSNFAERVALGTVFDSVQQAAYQTFFALGAGLGQ